MDDVPDDIMDEDMLVPNDEEEPVDVTEEALN
jgi:hypothetical protein